MSTWYEVQTAFPAGMKNNTSPKMTAVFNPTSPSLLATTRKKQSPLESTIIQITLILGVKWFSDYQNYSSRTIPQIYMVV